MGVLRHTEPWFRITVALLLVIEALLLATWAGHDLSRPTAPLSPTGQPHTSLARTSPTTTTSAQPGRIAEGRGIVGPLRLGMQLSQVAQQLNEEPVMVQRVQHGTRRFEALLPRAGLKISGRGRAVDTITVTNSGSAVAWKTSTGIGIGSSSRQITRAYTLAQEMCRRGEWVVQRGANTLRFTVSGRVTSMTLSSRTSPDIVWC